jgi:hypothetical protein
MVSAGLAAFGMLLMTAFDRKVLCVPIFWAVCQKLIRLIGMETGLYKPHQEEPRNSETRKITASSIIAYLSIVFLGYKFIYDYKSVHYGMAGSLSKVINLDVEESAFIDGIRAIAEIRSRKLQF